MLLVFWIGIMAMFVGGMTFFYAVFFGKNITLNRELDAFRGLLLMIVGSIAFLIGTLGILL